MVTLVEAVCALAAATSAVVRVESATNAIPSIRQSARDFNVLRDIALHPFFFDIVFMKHDLANTQDGDLLWFARHPRRTPPPIAFGQRSSIVLIRRYRRMCGALNA
jgi:hypothetical protein